ncbi:hypothetical protein E1B28_008204 [Marasmius oreades]|uniref:Uncharacterized protein n=1 Tax=Marasmius oreades TaxID=181124 RepID=A0A9P7UT27_9AGAR|nr:uncharacterized protein E1B28_008204 [Marasmius oreades]KAG7091801.1 hypothetical protein E1B28_008204 [Marasmius oreades]
MPLPSLSGYTTVSDSCDEENQSKKIPWSLRELRTFQNRLEQRLEHVEQQQQYNTTMLQEILRKLDDMSEHGVDELKHVVDKLLEDSETQNTFIQSNYLESSRVSRRPRIKPTFATPSPSSPPEPWKYNTLRLLPSSPI